MTRKFYPFPSIKQLRHISHIKKEGQLDYIGTIKLHGSNAAIVIKLENNKAIDMYYQTRNKKTTIVDDNIGFVKFITPKEQAIRENIKIKGNHTIILYGEFAGNGIQSGVAINQLPKMFVIFAIRNVIDEKWISLDNFPSIPDHNIYNVSTFPSYNITIDFSNTERIQNTLTELTNQVEAECPVGKYFGVSGVGEGIVWRCITPNYESSRYWFKTKGEKHAVSKVVTGTKIIDNNIINFVDNNVTDNRLNQGLEYLREIGIPIDNKATKEYIQWILADVIKEESDTMQTLDKQAVSNIISKKARTFFMNYVQYKK